MSEIEKVVRSLSNRSRVHSLPPKSEIGPQHLHRGPASLLCDTGGLSDDHRPNDQSHHT